MPNNRFDTGRPIDRVHNGVAQSLPRRSVDMEDQQLVVADSFGGPHVQPPLVEYRRPKRERRAHMYEVVPLQIDDLIGMLRRDGYAIFWCFDAMSMNRTFGGTSVGRRMVAVKFMTSQVFDTSYAFCRK